MCVCSFERVCSMCEYQCAVFDVFVKYKCCACVLCSMCV